MDAIQRVGQRCFFEEVDFSQICPNFKEFEIDRKMQFYAFLFGVLAYDESSCLADAVGKGVNDRADGLFQLEYSRDQREDAGRDPVFCATNRGVNSQSIPFQMECAASIFRDGYCRRKLTPGKDFWYWHRLNGSSKNYPVTRVGRKFPFCRQ